MRGREGDGERGVKDGGVERENLERGREREVERQGERERRREQEKEGERGVEREKQTTDAIFLSFFGQFEAPRSPGSCKRQTRLQSG